MSMIANILRVTQTELETYLKNSSLLENRVYSDDGVDDNLEDIDKSWDGIIYLLTGGPVSNTGHPLVKVLFSEQFIDEEQDLGYGPAHYLTPAQVAGLNKQIAGITIAELKQNYNPQKMAELSVYPEIWNEAGDESFDYLAEYFTAIKTIYATATENNEAIITFLN